MSDEANEDDSVAVYLTGQVEERAVSLRWTPTTFLVDILEALATMIRGIAGFYQAQAESLAVRASLKEELQDRAIRQRLHQEARAQVKANMLDDLAELPETHLPGTRE